jgi:molybdenum ABC transporter molybdate-binding protein
MRTFAARAAICVAILLGSLGRPALPASSGERTLTVFAAASLTDAFRDLGRRFESTHPGVRVRFSFGASNVLALQIRDGASVDLFASAAKRPIQHLAAAGELTDSALIIARNRLVVVVPRDNPARIRSWSGIARPGVKLVLAAPGVPAGDYARACLDSAGILAAALRNLVSNEQSVRSVLTKVALGEADAGIVYRSDARSRRGVTTIAIPDTANAFAEYWLVVPKSSRERRLAREFRELVLSPAGQTALSRHGFHAARR